MFDLSSPGSSPLTRGNIRLGAGRFVKPGLLGPALVMPGAGRSGRIQVRARMHILPLPVSVFAALPSVEMFGGAALSLALLRLSLPFAFAFGWFCVGEAKPKC